MEMKELLDRCEFTIDYQKQEIDRLRAEVQRLTDLLEGNGLDAHTCLRLIYTSSESSESNRLKAAGLAIPFEKGKRLSEPAPLELVPQPVVSLAERCKTALAYHDRLLAMPLEERSALIPGVSGANVTVRNGNGQDDQSSD
jgi:hypothetical protein